MTSRPSIATTIDADDAGVYCCRRLFEWMASAMQLGLAMVLLASPRSIETGDFRYLDDVGLTPWAVGLMALAVGMLRVVALYRNGHWPATGPRLRVVGALASAILWGQMTICLAVQMVTTAAPPIALPVFIGLIVGELATCYRSATDVRSPARRGS